MWPQAAFLNSIGPGELVLIFLVLLLVFGPRLPEVGRSLGSGIKEFKDGLKEGDAGKKTDGDTEPPAEKKFSPTNDEQEGPAGETDGETRYPG